MKKGHPPQILPGGAKPDELRELLRKLKEEMPVQLEITAELAKLTRAKYEAYVNAGFTEQQALYLCQGG